MLTAGSLDVEQLKREAALEKLLRDDIVVTYEAKKGQMHANTRDIFVSGVTVTFHGKPLIEDTDIQINYGNRYGFLGPNGSGKSTVRIYYIALPLLGILFSSPAQVTSNLTTFSLALLCFLLI